MTAIGIASILLPLAIRQVERQDAARMRRLTELLGQRRAGSELRPSRAEPAVREGDG